MSGGSPVRSSTTTGRVVVAVMAVLSVALSGAALAYACTPLANISIAGSSPALPGSQLNVAGSGFEGNVTVRWGSASGAVLATATTHSSFGATITVPDVAPDTYFVVAIARDAGGAFIGQASAPVEVRAPAPTPAVAAPSQPAGSDAPAATAAAADDTPASTPTRTPDAGRPAAQQTSRPVAAQTPRPAARPVPARPAAQQRPNTPARAHAQPDRRPAPAAPPRRFFDTPVTAAVTPAPAAVVQTGNNGAGARHAAAKTARNAPANGDTTAAGRPATHPAAAASATPAPSLDSPVSVGALQRDDAGSRLAIGIGMLALSLVALLGSFLVAEVRRRRAPLRSRDG